MKVDPRHAGAREIDGLVFALRADGASLADVARELGVSPARIREREIRAWTRLLRAANAAQPRLERRARAKSGETGRSTSAPAPEGSTGPIGETDVERPDSSKSGRSAGFACVRPFGCFRPACIAEGRCRMDPNHPRFKVAPPAPAWEPRKCGRPDCPDLEAEHFGGYCVRHGFDHRKFCRYPYCGRAPASGSRLCLKHIEEELRCDVMSVLRSF